jgi:tRNA-specific 2-thiouridylase
MVMRRRKSAQGGGRTPRVVVGLSGGVDSSVAAALLKQRGYDVTGVFMEIYGGAGRGGDDGPRGGMPAGHACYGPGEEEDLRRAASVCRTLDIPLYSIDLRREYRREVIQYVREQYLSGRTPNPCVRCNEVLKFGFLLERLREQGLEFDYFATGHYARIERHGERFLLKKAADPLKDQTYFLYTLGQEQLSRVLFPVGDCTKEQVRARARELGLSTAGQEESQDFIEGGSYAALFGPGELSGGEIVGPGGKVLGQHRGVVRYTVGQRRGLGVSWRRPLYVTGIDARANRIMVGEKSDLMAGGLVAGDVRLPSLPGPEGPFRATARIRLGHPGAEATVYPRDDGTVQVLFDRPQSAVAPGQAVVFYDRSLVLGGGTILKAVG